MIIHQPPVPELGSAVKLNTMAQNTAMQELITQIKGAISIIDRHGVLNDYAQQRKDVYVSILDVATELLPKERQQIGDAHFDGQKCAGCEHPSGHDALAFFTQTFTQNK